MSKFCSGLSLQQCCLPVLSSLGPSISSETIDSGSCSFNTLFFENIRSFVLFCFINKGFMKTIKNAIFQIEIYSNLLDNYFMSYMQIIDQKYHQGGSLW